mgnify:CR=1 FL=1
MEAVVYYRNRIRRLGYQPNVNGRNLASKKSNRIALIIPDLLKRERKDNITFRSRFSSGTGKPIPAGRDSVMDRTNA